MDGRGTGAGAGGSPPTGSYSTPCVHEQMRKRQRSNPGPETGPYDDVLGGGSWRYSPVSDPDIDYNVQASKRYLSEVMANNLTRHMSLRHISSPSAAPLPFTSGLGIPGGDIHSLTHPHAALPPLPQAHLFSTFAQSHGPGPLTPPGGCSPQRTCISEMSEGLPDPAGGEVAQPMNVSDASHSQGGCAGGATGASGSKASAAATAESTSETADSDLLYERERSVSLSGTPWCHGSGASTAGFSIATAAVASGVGGVATGRVPLPPGVLLSASSVAHLGVGHGAISGSTGSPFSSQGALSRRMSDAPQGAGPAGPASAAQQQHQQQHMGRGPYPRGHTSGGRGMLPDMPSSPSDSRFGGLDLRKTALLRNFAAASRRTEETTSDGGTAVAMAAASGYHPSGAIASVGLGIMMADSGSSESAAGTSTCAAAAMAMSAVATRGSFAVRGGGNGGRSATSRSDSGLSDGMSEGDRGGATGMELSSNSADGGGAGAGGSGVLVGNGPEDPLSEQQRQKEESDEARLGVLHQPRPHAQLAAAPSHTCVLGVPGAGCMVAGGTSGTSAGTSLPPAYSCSLGSPPGGLTTPLPVQPPAQLQRERNSIAGPPSCNQF
ncbi:hypothetical protein VOLCADRAFT_90743 [Volvox carteri f. nagariensis]|uniref:Uncharacterized protein n=1 Tax=Volvox carteri f. nagariensis TaxID=3068 RepID=D8TVM0_VOLCA|nr:uncharacterized protein VOLCADRAFT_90743 [Volvox carteri f. nagariensis]EFJ48477.1 hypothetical protein VOLCADRAFT_90743 [Volvox carteri f. nagariensis]|eukprot:XP_002950276.1 hypothetical protein VOLCADRAFT_90743 [Volvox carteri f. nagariensis]